MVRGPDDEGVHPADVHRTELLVAAKVVPKLPAPVVLACKDDEVGPEQEHPVALGEGAPPHHEGEDEAAEDPEHRAGPDQAVPHERLPPKQLALVGALLGNLSEDLRGAALLGLPPGRHVPQQGHHAPQSHLLPAVKIRATLTVAANDGHQRLVVTEEHLF